MEEIQTVKLTSSKDTLIKKENIYLLVFSFALGILFDILFYGKTLGLSYPLFVVVFYGLLFWNMRDSLNFKLNFTWLLSIPILLLSFTYLFFENILFKVLNFAAIPILIAAHTLLLTSSNRYNWFKAGFIKDLLYAMIARPLENVTKPFSIIIKISKKKSEPGRFAVVGKILAGLLVSVPLVMIIVSLLASADEVFNHLIGNIPNLFENVNLNDLAARLFIIIVVTCFTFSYLWSLIYQKIQTVGSQAKSRLSSARFLDPITIITVLVMVNIIYVIFTIIQFSYLFGSLSIGLPDSFTYAQYARRGFFELVAVTMINLAILLGNINFAKSADAGIEKIVRILNSVLVACTLIMLFSAHFRMSLYEDAYGYTYLRILTHAFMAYLFALLAVTLYKIWRSKTSLIKYYVIISIVAYTIINYVNIDVIIAKNNIERYNRYGKIDVSYLASLSDDSVPYLVDFINSGLDKGLSKKLEESLNKKRILLEAENRWQSFNIAEFRAKRALKGLNLN